MHLETDRGIVSCITRQSKSTNTTDVIAHRQWAAMNYLTYPLYGWFPF